MILWVRTSARTQRGKLVCAPQCLGPPLDDLSWRWKQGGDGWDSFPLFACFSQCTAVAPAQHSTLKVVKILSCSSQLQETKVEANSPFEA